MDRWWGRATRHEVADALARWLPEGPRLVLEGATHDIVPVLLGPIVEGFRGNERAID